MHVYIISLCKHVFAWLHTYVMGGMWCHSSDYMYVAPVINWFCITHMYMYYSTQCSSDAPPYGNGPVCA